MSAVVAARQQPGSATHSAGSTSNTGSRMGTHSPVDNKRPNPKSEDKSSRLSDQSNSRGDVPKNAPKGLSPLSNQGTNSVHPHVSVNQPPDASTSGQSNNHGQQPARSLPNKSKIQAETPDYFSISHNSRLDQEPNPFEQSFASSPKTILPPVTAITSPSPLLPGGSAGSGFNWGLNSLRSGPLSPAMLQGPASNSNVGSAALSFDPRISTGLTPNESGIRSGLTPGGSGPLFSAPSPATTNALFQFIGGGTPGTMEFQRTALSAARKSTTHPPPPLVVPHIKTEDRASNPDHSQQKQRQHSDGFHTADPAHNAASGLFLLARAKHPEQEDVVAANAAIAGSGPGYQGGNQAPSGISGVAGAAALGNTSPSLAKQALVNNASNAAMGAAVNRSASGGSIPNSVRGISEISDDFSDSGGEEIPTSIKRNTRAKNAKNKPSSSTTARRKAEDSPSGGGRSQNKKAKGPQGQSMSVSGSDDGRDEGGKESKKMTDEEKRKNFLERNRVAALKCRQRKKQWLASLQAKVELFSSENDALTAQVTSLREEIVSLKTLLLAHKDCPVARSNGGGMSSMDLTGNITGDYSHVPMMNHYGNVTGMGSCVMAPPSGGRRYS